MQKSQTKNINKASDAYYAEELLAQAGCGIYVLVRMAITRALEINAGRPALVKHPSEKATTLALEEIMQGKIAFKEGSLNKEVRVGIRNSAVRINPAVLEEI